MPIALLLSENPAHLHLTRMSSIFTYILTEHTSVIVQTVDIIFLQEGLSIIYPNSIISRMPITLPLSENPAHYHLSRMSQILPIS